MVPALSADGCAQDGGMAGTWVIPNTQCPPVSALCLVGGLSGEHAGKVTPSEVSFRPQGVHSPGLHAGLQRWVRLPSVPASVPTSTQAGL